MNLYILDDPDLQHCWHIVVFILELEIHGAEHCNFTSVLIIRPQNFFVYSLYRNPDLDDRIYEYLLTAMAAVQAGGVRA